jgi:hypothetical protein
MLKKRNAQAAMEFLMTYGWAILVVLVVIGALAYFGVLNPQRMLPPKCTFAPGLSCGDFVVTKSTETITLNLVNGLGKGIIISTITATGTGTAPVCTYTAGAGSVPPEMDPVGSVIYQLKNGAATDFVLDCADPLPSADPNTKSRWDIALVWYYDDSSDSFTKTMTGELLTSVEP